MLWRRIDPKITRAGLAGCMVTEDWPVRQILLVSVRFPNCDAGESRVTFAGEIPLAGFKRYQTFVS